MQFDHHDIKASGHVEVRWVREDESYFREVLAPGADLSALPEEVADEIEAFWTPEILEAYAETNQEPAPSLADLKTAICEAINSERDRRIDGGFTFAGHTFQSRPSDRENVMGAAQMALAAIGQGAAPGNLRWAVPPGAQGTALDVDFQWIDAENHLVPLDAFQTVGLFQTGAAFKSALTFYARAMKDAVLASSDPASIDWSNWPG